MNWPKVPVLGPLRTLTLRSPSSLSGGSPAAHPCPGVKIALSLLLLSQLCNMQPAWPPQHPCYITSSWLPLPSPHTGPWFHPPPHARHSPMLICMTRVNLILAADRQLSRKPQGTLATASAQPSGPLGAQEGTALHLGSERAHPALNEGCE